MWIKLDDGFATHPKILKAGPRALVLQIRAICYASQNHTDGFLPVEIIPSFITDLPLKDQIEWPTYMVSHKLWEVCDGGYQIHDFLHWNMSREEYFTMKAKLSSAGKKGMKSRWKSHNTPYKVGYKVKDNLAINPPITHPITSCSTSIETSSPNSLNPQDLKSKGHTKIPKRGLRPISEDDKPSEKHFSFGRSLNIDVGPEWGKFKNYCLAHDKRYANFEAAFRNWLANVPTMKGSRA